MATGNGRQAQVLRTLVRDHELADQLARVAELLEADIESLEAVPEAPQERDATPCLVEASFIVERTDFPRLEAGLAPGSEIILLGIAKERERLAEWLRAGRAFFLRVPLDRDYLVELLRDMFSEQSGNNTGTRSTTPPALDQYGLLFGSSDVMRELYRHLRKAARTDAALLICGESGTGKELIARSVHSYSDRCDDAFESINCGAIPAELLESELFGHEKGSFTGADRRHRGLFERAGPGTLFLDEITEMPLAAQTRLLRVLETDRFRRVGGQTELRCEARVMTASNRDPLRAIEEGELRQDLYYRICQMEVTAPPLRERGEDIVHLARLFTRLYAQQTGRAVRLSRAAEEALLEHDWPGNVRELRHAVLSAARLSRGVIRRDDLETGSAGQRSAQAAGADDAPRLRAGMRIADMERALIDLTLHETGGNKEQAARLLGISVRTLYNRLKRYADS